MPKTLVIDHYDSFTFNLVQYLGELGGNPSVFRNGEITLEEARTFSPTHIVISPGPGHPENPEYFGISGQLIREMGKDIPLLGVCLGHQGICSVFGGKVVPAPQIMHGKVSKIYHDGEDLFQNVANPFEAMRYHSLIADPESVPDELEITARSEEGLIMAIRHRHFPVWGIQFHPESIGTPEGKKIIANFLNSRREMN